MKSSVTILVIMFTAVVLGIFNKRWAVACALFVLHIAIGSFIIGCVSHWASERQNVAFPSGHYIIGKDRG